MGSCLSPNGPYWLSKDREEVEAVAAKYSINQSAPLVEQLAQLHVEVWESEFPTQDMCLRVSIRLQTIGTFFSQEHQR